MPMTGRIRALSASGSSRPELDVRLQIPYRCIADARSRDPGNCAPRSAMFTQGGRIMDVSGTRMRCCSGLRYRAVWTLLLLVVASISSATTTDIEQHIEHIQDNLLPPVLVEGESISSSKLSDRMAALHVPGVSIAVIHAGKLVWARGFGVVRVGRNSGHSRNTFPGGLHQQASHHSGCSAPRSPRQAQSSRRF